MSKEKQNQVTYPHLRKLKRMIFSHYFVAATIIILEVIWLTLLCVFLYNYSAIISILSTLLSIAVLLYIINKDGAVETKLAWIIIVALLPVVGAAAYLIVHARFTYRKLTARHAKVLQTAQSFQTPGALNKLKTAGLAAYREANFIYQNSTGTLRDDTKVTYYRLGDDFYPEFLNALKSAEQFIFIEFFIIRNGKLWGEALEILKQKAAAGVEIHILYDDIGSFLSFKRNYWKDLRLDGVDSAISNKVNHHITNLHNHRDHRKIIVIDNKIGFTGGVNLADEYVNLSQDPKHWKDTALKLEGPGVSDLTSLFLQTWNVQPGAKPLNFKKYLTNQTSKHHDGYTLFYGAGPEPFHERELAKQIYLNLINDAKESLHITTPYLIIDSETMNALKRAARKGVDVKIITPHIPDKRLVFLMTQSSYADLIKSGVKIYEYTPGFIHAKNVIADGATAISGTINLDYRSLVYHFECALWMHQTKCLKTMEQDFAETLKKSKQITLKTAKLPLHKKLLAEIFKIFAPLL